MRKRHPFEQQRHRGDQVALALLQSQAPNVADQQLVGPDAQLGSDALARPLERSRDGRLEPVVDASHAARVAHPARYSEPRDVVGDGDDQVLSSRNEIVNDADERVQEEAVVVVAGRHQQWPLLAQLSQRQPRVDVRPKQVRVDDVERALAQERHQSTQRERIEAAAGAEQVDLDTRFPKHGHQLTVAAQDRRFDLERGAVGVGQQRQEVVFGSAAFERRDELQDPN